MECFWHPHPYADDETQDICSFLYANVARALERRLHEKGPRWVRRLACSMAPIFGGEALRCENVALFFFVREEFPRFLPPVLSSLFCLGFAWLISTISERFLAGIIQVPPPTTRDFLGGRNRLQQCRCERTRNTCRNCWDIVFSLPGMSRVLTKHC